MHFARVRRIALLLSALFLVPAMTLAQPNTAVDSAGVQRVQYTRLDQMTFGQKNIFTGKRATLTLNFVELKNLDTGQALQGVEVKISRKNRKQIGGSIAFSAVGSLFGTSGSATYRRIQKSGYIFLRQSDLAKITDFLDAYPSKVQPDQRRVWKISLTKDFELGVAFSPEDYDGVAFRTGYSFLVTAKETTYRMDWNAGLNMAENLSSWHKRMSATTQ